MTERMNLQNVSNDELVRYIRIFESELDRARLQYRVMLASFLLNISLIGFVIIRLLS